MNRRRPRLPLARRHDCSITPLRARFELIACAPLALAIAQPAVAQIASQSALAAVSLPLAVEPAVAAPLSSGIVAPGEQAESIPAVAWSLPQADAPRAIPASPLDPVAPGLPAMLPGAQDIARGDAADPRYASFGARVGAVKWETLGLAAYLTAINLPDVIDHPSGFSFENEGLFGRSTANLGIDKLAHAFNAYVLSDILYARMKRKTGASPDAALTAAALATGLQVYAELFDGFKQRSGFSIRDVGFNVVGSGFSYLRNAVPGLKEKLDFRLLFMPNRDFYSVSNGKEHFRQERFLFALKLSGFEGIRATPLRFVELHAGYYARGFTDRERARGDRPERKPFFGIGLNLNEVLFPTPRSTVPRAAHTALKYLQIPYTAVHID